MSLDLSLFLKCPDFFQFTSILCVIIVIRGVVVTFEHLNFTNKFEFLVAILSAQFSKSQSNRRKEL